ncbi:MAG: hypothetical protein QM689_07635 [Oscillospiraceae bacterium]
MKRTIAVIAALVVVLSFSACGKDDTSSKATDGAKTAAATNAVTTAATTDADSSAAATTTAVTTAGIPAGSITVTFPDDWIDMEPTASVCQYMKGTGSCFVNKYTLAGGSLDAIGATAVEQMTAATENFARTADDEHVTICGRDAIKLSFTCNAAGMDMQYVYYYTYVDPANTQSGDVYQITFGDLKDSFSEIEPDIDGIINSITFE